MLAPHGLTRTIFVVVLLAPAGFSWAQPAGWHTSGPTLTSVNAISAAPDTETTVYVGASIYEASQSAIFGSTDGGGTWTALFEPSRGDYLSELLVDPRDPRWQA